MYNDEKFTKFGNRLYNLGELKGLNLRDSKDRRKIATEICNDSKYQKIYSHKGSYINIVGTITDHLFKYEFIDIQTKWVLAYSMYFGCSIDYLAGIIEQPTHETTDIYNVTGLSLNAIQGIQNIKKWDDERNKNKQLGLCLTDTLNVVLSNNFVLDLLQGIKDYISPYYTVPVYHTGKKILNNDGEKVNEVKNSPFDKYKYDSGDTLYFIHLAKDEKNLYENIPIPITHSLLQEKAIGDIRRSLNHYITSEF